MKNLSSLFLTLAIVMCTTLIQAQEYGIASFYSDDFHGRKTAYGDIYDKNKMTAAHKKHPRGTLLKVTRLDNNKSVTVKVNDKGPYIKGRVIDVSRKAAEQLGLLKSGTAEVKVEVVSRASSSSSTASSSRSSSSKSSSTTSKGSSSSSSKSTSSRSSSSSSRKSSSSTIPRDYESSRETRSSTSASQYRLDTKGLSSSRSAPKSFPKVGKDYTQYGLYKIELERPDKRGYGIQVASLYNYENVLKQVADLQAKWFQDILISVERGDGAPLYKIILGPQPTEKAAVAYKANLKKKHKMDGFVVDLGLLQY